ncbi:2-C-methyl-D-erythritol 4-phosphate cytidylyltransferase [Erysipelotrichaceae bacterium]|nr:2-C-methyl-D-erythritol 4-phosphate cytidylyltransferase [Erysipelotrichaceae bacterium]
MQYDVILTAAGSGSRTKLGYNKVFLPIENKPCFMYSVELFLADSGCGTIYITIAAQEEQKFDTALKAAGIERNRVKLVYGGKTRQESVFAALKQVKSYKVFVHDGSRPFLKSEKLTKMKALLAFEKAVILGVKATDTLKEVDAFNEVSRTIKRDHVYYAQTPQAFDRDALYTAHELAENEGFMATDDAQIIEYAGKHRVQIVEGDKYNMKITTPDDIEIAAVYMKILNQKKGEV